MQILIKALTGRQFKIEIDLEKTVQDLKEKIFKDEGSDFKIENQKLIYEGKILADANKLSEYKIDAKKFVVLLITRPPPPPKKVEEHKPPATVSKKEESTSKSDKSTKEETTGSSAARSSGRPSTTSSSQATSDSQQPSATDPNQNAARSRSSANPPRMPSTPSSQARDLGGAGVESNMAARLNHLMSLPNFANLQATLHQNPHLLSSAIESLSTADPEMYRFVSENPDLFLNALNSAPAGGMASNRSSASRQRRSEARGQALVSEAGGGGGAEQFSIQYMLPSATDHDKQAIERLKELGFSELQAIQAYVACDKDEHLAANLLFSMDQ